MRVVQPVTPDEDMVRLLTIEEAGERLGLRKRAAYQLAATGTLPTVLLPATTAGQKRREMRVRLTDLAEFMARLDAA